jgi:AcrR family transcriptional regulator
MKNEQTRQRLIRVTKELVLSEGYESVTVRRIAEAAGCTYPLLYHYFKDMDALFWQLRLEMIEDMIVELTPVSEQFNEPVHELKQVFASYAGYYFKHPNIFRFFYYYPFKRPESGDEFFNLEQRSHEMWHHSFEKLVQTGSIKKDDVEIAAKTIIYSIQGMILLSSSANGSLSESSVYQEIDGIIDYLFRKDTPHG